MHLRLFKAHNYNFITFAKTKVYLSFDIALSNYTFFLFFAKLHLVPKALHIIFKKEVNSNRQFLFQRGIFS